MEGFEPQPPPMAARPEAAWPPELERRSDRRAMPTERLAIVETRVTDLERRTAILESTEAAQDRAIAALETSVSVVATRLSIYASLGGMAGGAAAALIAKAVAS